MREWMKVIFWCFFLHCKWFVFFSAFQAETWCPQNISAATRIWFSSVQTCSCSSSDIDVDWFRNAESSYLRWISVCISLSVEPWAKIWETTFARLDFFFLNIHSRQSTICMMHGQCHLDLPYLVTVLLKNKVKVIQMQNFPKSQNLHVSVLKCAHLKIARLTCHENVV